MIEILIITSSGNPEFTRWIDGGHGERTKEGLYLIAKNDIRIHVKNGKAKNEMSPEEKAECVRKWMKKPRPAQLDKRYVIIHGQFDELEYLTTSLETESEVANIDFRDYSSVSEGRRLYKIVEKFFSKQNQAESVAKELISALSGRTDQEKADKASRLRAEILSPLVALDLIQQAEKEGKIENPNSLSDFKKEILQAMKNLTKPLDEFCTLPVVCTGFKEQIDKLLNWRADPSGKDWKSFHSELKEVAQQMETQIERIAQ